MEKLVFSETSFSFAPEQHLLKLTGALNAKFYYTPNYLGDVGCLNSFGDSIFFSAVVR